MTRYRVSGIHQRDGNGCEVSLTAEDEKQALLAARKSGVFATKIEEEPGLPNADVPIDVFHRREERSTCMSDQTEAFPRMPRGFTVLIACAVCVAVAGVTYAISRTIASRNFGASRALQEAARDNTTGEPAPGALHATPLSPEARLLSIAQRGKARIPDGSTVLVDLNVDVTRSSSLIYPFVGRIISTWDMPNGRGRVWVYYKYDGQKWIPTWATKGAVGEVGILTPSDALRVPPDPRMQYPWATTNVQVRAWEP